MRNATYELAMPSSPTTLSTARATASVVTSFALTAAATAIFNTAIYLLSCSSGFSLITDHL